MPKNNPWIGIVVVIVILIIIFVIFFYSQGEELPVQPEETAETGDFGSSLYSELEASSNPASDVNTPNPTVNPISNAYKNPFE